MESVYPTAKDSPLPAGPVWKGFRGKDVGGIASAVHFIELFLYFKRPKVSYLSEINFWG